VSTTDEKGGEARGRGARGGEWGRGAFPPFPDGRKRGWDTRRSVAGGFAFRPSTRRSGVWDDESAWAPPARAARPLPPRAEAFAHHDEP